MYFCRRLGCATCLCRRQISSRECSFSNKSAGQGYLAKAIARQGGIVHCLEKREDFRLSLTKQGFLVIGTDFLLASGLKGKCERLVQNPPFSQQANHVKKAYQCLKPGGRLVSLTSEFPWKSNRYIHQQFRYWCQQRHAYHEQLPPGLFVNSERYTEVVCHLLIIDR